LDHEGSVCIGTALLLVALKCRRTPISSSLGIADEKALISGSSLAAKYIDVSRGACRSYAPTRPTSHSQLKQPRREASMT
jgi:hypothetical protein